MQRQLRYRPSSVHTACYQNPTIVTGQWQGNAPLVNCNAHLHGAGSDPSGQSPAVRGDQNKSLSRWGPTTGLWQCHLPSPSESTAAGWKGWRGFSQGFDKESVSSTLHVVGDEPMFWHTGCGVFANADSSPPRCKRFAIYDAKIFTKTKEAASQDFNMEHQKRISRYYTEGEIYSGPIRVLLRCFRVPASKT